MEIPQTAPITFDLSIWQMFAGLTAGATVCVVPDTVVQDPASFIDHAIRHRYPVMAVVPTFLAVLLDQLEEDRAAREGMRSVLRQLISTGELLSPHLVQRWYACMPDISLLNAYGPAEVADDSTGGQVPAGDGPVTTVGKVLPGVQIYILDADLQPVPTGVRGEIYIGGESVGRGYLGDPELTAAAFLPDPFTKDPGRCMYRTGDRGRWRPDGNVELLGRLDNQVKIRGRRVELGEIENTIRGLPGVARAVVEVVTEGTLSRLVAFVVPADGRTLTGEDVKTFAASRLPGYMVPATVFVLDDLPRNTNGKTDRKALRDLARERRRGGDVTAPRDPVERVLWEVWSRHLKTRRLGVRDDFFDLGGDSVLAIRMVQEARRRGVSLRPRDVLARRTIEALAALARADGAAEVAPAGGASPVEAQQADRLPAQSAPLTPVQLAFLARRLPQPNHWNQSVLFGLRQGVSLPSIEAAVGTLADRHVALRSRFVRTAWQTTYQQLAGPGGRDALPVTEFDLTAVSPDEAGQQVEQLADSLHRRLDLEAGPAARAGVIRMPGAGPDRLLLVIHHAVMDLYSWDVLTEELTLLLCHGDDARLEDITTSYFDWARRLSEHVRAAPASLNAEYWTSRDWSGSATIADGDDRGLEGDSEEIELRFDEEWTASFTAAGRATGTTVFERLLSALCAAFQTWLGLAQGTILLQLSGHGREDIFDDVDLSRTVGFFNAAYPLALPLPGRCSAREHTTRLAEIMRAVPCNGFDFDVLAQAHPDG